MRSTGIYALLALGAAVAAVLVAAGPAAAANYPCGTTFTAAGTYHIYGNQSYSGTCYTIAHDGVTLYFEPGNSTITETKPSASVIDDTGGYSGLTVENGKIVGGGNQVDLRGVADSNVINMTLTGGYYGVWTLNSTDTLIKGNTIDGDGFGVYLAANDTTDVIAGNTISDSGTGGIFIDSSAGIVISGNTITGSQSYGIEADEANAGLAINGNVLDSNDTGLYIDRDSGDQIANNYIQDSTGVRNSGDGVEDWTSDLNAYTGNILTNDVGDGFFVWPGGYGPVTMVNNTSEQSQGGAGFYVYGAFNRYAYGGPFSLFSGNRALYNTGAGFSDEATGIAAGHSTNETWTQNSAWENAGDGFRFAYPLHFTITGNSGSYNGGDGFHFVEDASPYAPVSFANNAAMYNAGTGFYAVDPLPGSGNTGGGTNGGADCYLVAGCN